MSSLIKRFAVKYAVCGKNYVENMEMGSLLVDILEQELELSDLLNRYRFVCIPFNQIDDVYNPYSDDSRAGNTHFLQIKHAGRVVTIRYDKPHVLGVLKEHIISCNPLLQELAEKPPAKQDKSGEYSRYNWVNRAVFVE